MQNHEPWISFDRAIANNGHPPLSTQVLFRKSPVIIPFVSLSVKGSHTGFILCYTKRNHNQIEGKDNIEKIVNNADKNGLTIFAVYYFNALLVIDSNKIEKFSFC